jgi:formate-dependent nitrite reductase membrane component NrfD
MNAVIAAVPPVVTGMPVAVTIAVAVTAAVALVMLAAMLRRTLRPTRLTVGISVISALAVLVGALLVGGSLTQPPTAAATEGSTSRAQAYPPIELKLTGLQLPTI